MNISREDYLRVMYELYENRKEGIKSVDIANALNVTKPSVSQMIKNLCNEKLIVTEPYSKIQFTKKGFKEARRMMYIHRVIEVFLKKVLKYDIDKVHEEAHRLEHAFSQKSIDRLDEFLNKPKKSPHGRIIPR
jgi:DtxR family transcriptional regulator, Mn-dependent transcriptional regulator